MNPQSSGRRAVFHDSGISKGRSNASSRDGLPAISKLLQIGDDRGVQPRSLGLLLAQRRDKALHLLVERLVVVLSDLGADVPSRGQDVAVLPDLLDRRALAEARDVGALAGLLLPTPRVVGPGDALDLLVGKLAVRAAHHDAQLPGVAEEHLAPPVHV